MKPSSSSEGIFGTAPDGTMDIVTIDIETTMADTNSSRSASNPYYEDNRIVAFGAKALGGDPVCTYHLDSTHIVFEAPSKQPPPFILVGHNIKFDLNWMRRRYKDPNAYDDYISVAKIWDTQIAEYIISGQTSKFASLNSVAVERDMGAKIDLTFEMPLGATAFKDTELLPYLERDLKLTEQIALEQMSECTNEQFDLIIQMGDALKVLAEMEWNGMHINEDMLIDKLAQVGIETHNTAEKLSDFVENPDLVKAKPEWYNSSQILSCIIFGGTVHYEKKIAAGLWKSGAKKGMPRYRKEDMKQEFPGFVVPRAVDAKKGKKKTKSGDVLYSVDEDTLETIMNTVILPSGCHEMLTDVIRMRELKKVSGTYYENLLDMEMDDIVHHNLNQTATFTGRLSSSSPNLQNVPMAGDEEVLNVKQCFDSRFGSEGMILEVDFKQLEVCALAWLTEDPQLIEDIKKGLDIHATIAKELGLDARDKRIRRAVKTIVFAMIYGSGWKGIVKSSGLDEHLVKDVIKGFHARYSKVRLFYDDLTELIAKSPRYDLLSRDKDGNPCPMFEWTCITGRKYIFKQDQFRPGPAYTTTRNYPVQGTATGDIVPVVIAEIGDVLRNARKGIKNNCKIVTTTHDSVTFDCKDYDSMKDLIQTLEHRVFNDVNKIINQRIPTIKWNIPLEVEYEAGPNWGEMKTLDKTCL